MGENLEKYFNELQDFFLFSEKSKALIKWCNLSHVILFQDF